MNGFLLIGGVFSFAIVIVGAALLRRRRLRALREAEQQKQIENARTRVEALKPQLQEQIDIYVNTFIAHRERLKALAEQHKDHWPHVKDQCIANAVTPIIYGGRLVNQMIERLKLVKYFDAHPRFADRYLAEVAQLDPFILSVPELFWMKHLETWDVPAGIITHHPLRTWPVRMHVQAIAPADLGSMLAEFSASAATALTALERELKDPRKLRVMRMYKGLLAGDEPVEAETVSA